MIKQLYAKVKKTVKKGVTWGINKLFAATPTGRDINSTTARRNKKLKEAAGK